MSLCFLPLSFLGVGWTWCDLDGRGGPGGAEEGTEGAVAQTELGARNSVLTDYSFYESQGFVLVDDFVSKRPGKDFGDFEGALLRMDL